MNKARRISLLCIFSFALGACSDDVSSPKLDRPRQVDLFPGLADAGCPGCFSGALCMSGNTAGACGLGGSTCQTCSSTQQCQSGACVPSSTTDAVISPTDGGPPRPDLFPWLPDLSPWPSDSAACGPSTCTAGCCTSKGQCVSPPTALSCGIGGNPCVACKTGGESCSVSGICASATYQVVLKSAAILLTDNCLPPLSACDSAVELTTGSCTKKSKYVYDNNSPIYDEVMCASLAASAITSKFSGRMVDPNSPLPEVELCTFDAPPSQSAVTATGSHQVDCTRGALKFKVATILFEFIKN